MPETKITWYRKLSDRIGSKWFAFLIVVMIGVAILGTFLSITFLFAIGFAEGTFSQEFCFHSECIEGATKTFGASYSIIEATVGLLVAIATIGGIFVALSSYLATSGATAFGNHIAHLGIFQAYASAEIAKRNRISAGSIDVFKWYRLIFPDAGMGRLSVSEEYENIVIALRNEIDTSNMQAAKAIGGSFRYVPHQERVIAAVASFGIGIHRQPRVAYFEIEDEVFSLIRAVNFAFCKDSKNCMVPKRNYY